MFFLHTYYMKRGRRAHHFVQIILLTTTINRQNLNLRGLPTPEFRRVIHKVNQSESI